MEGEVSIPIADSNIYLLASLSEGTMKPMIFRSDLTNRWYYSTRYQDRGEGRFMAIQKTDITEQMEAILREDRRSVRRGKK